MADSSIEMFTDIFRRADKNDDGSLTFEEFSEFFNDGVLTTTDLEQLFHKIDVDGSGNISTDELAGFFSQHWGPFKDIFTTLEGLTKQVSKCLIDTHEASKDASDFDNTCHRFFLKEVGQAIGSIQVPLDQAHVALSRLALGDKPESSAHQVASHDPMRGLSSRRRARIQLQSSSGADRFGLKEQVSRLAALLDQMESKVRLGSVEQETVDDISEDVSTIVSRVVSCTFDGRADFVRAMRLYKEMSCSEDGCVDIHVRLSGDTHEAVLYEIWESASALDSHHVGQAWKTWRRSSIEFLAGPEIVKTIDVPEGWVRSYGSLWYEGGAVR